MQLEPKRPRERTSEPPIVCYVTDRNAFGSADPIADLLSSIDVALAAGVDWVQIREKDIPARELASLVEAVVRTKNEPRGSKGAARAIVNDRLDVALATGAGGVHLGRESVPARDVARWIRYGGAPPEFSVGVSCHSLQEVQSAEAAGADYVFFGPVFDTPSKRAFGPPQGIARLESVCKTARIPAIAIGGIDAGNATECLRAGAAGIAAIRSFQSGQDAELVASWIAGLHEFRAPAPTR